MARMNSTFAARSASNGRRAILARKNSTILVMNSSPLEAPPTAPPTINRAPDAQPRSTHHTKQQLHHFD